MEIVEFIVKNILHFMPVIFGFAFFGPLLGQIMGICGWVSPLGLSPLSLGLVIGGSWGILAQIRGSWIWFRP
ncbi:hypothetical protein A8B75_04860 [Sphingomonadales bacterium EhC05]|jgi:hypothetical protein|uniref:hypothetical protein n=1 Tax=Parasphingorhabdus sp. TaxID=2709688 RepID=UPI0007F35B5E|nr:hypothetical protein A8B75_04860 [Sphingomonadales bacterium EhC05]